MSGLKDAVVLITGASSGIGASLSRKFSEAGAQVVLVARRKAELERVASTCPGKTLIIQADITRPEDRERILTDTLEACGRLNVLVNNAGIGAYGDFLETPESVWREVFEINLFAPVLLTRMFVPLLLRSGGGLILNIASIAGLVAHAEKVSPYVASKHALLGFSRALQRDLAGDNIRVLAVCPHLTQTDFFSVSRGADAMTSLIEESRRFMDTPDTVAQGILDRIESDRLVVFPTDKPARAYERLKDL